MKKTAIITLGLILSANAMADNLPNGRFEGRGLWKSEKNTGSYSVTTEIRDNAVRGTYTLPDGKKKEWNFSMNESKPGFFTVHANGADVGSGYCLDKASVCHYEVHAYKIDLEETLTVMDGKLYRFGSKEQGGEKIVWQEMLERK